VQRYQLGWLHKLVRRYQLGWLHKLVRRYKEEKRAVEGQGRRETAILENSMTRLCQLLAVGFGDAGGRGGGARRRVRQGLLH
jgi:hypothetical protein